MGRGRWEGEEGMLWKAAEGQRRGGVCGELLPIAAERRGSSADIEDAACECLSFFLIFFYGVFPGLPSLPAAVQLVTCCHPLHAAAQHGVRGSRSRLI